MGLVMRKRPVFLVVLVWLLTALPGCGSTTSTSKRASAGAQSGVSSFTAAVPATGNTYASADGAVLVVVSPKSSGWVAYSLKTGRELGSASPATFDPDCGVAVARRGDGTHVVLSAAKTPSGGLVAVAANAASGTHLWSAPIPRSACANTLNGFVRVAADGSAALYPTTGGNLLLNLTTGAVKNIGGNQSSTGSNSEMIGSDAYVNTSGDTVNVYRASTGKPLPALTRASLALCLEFSCPVTMTPKGYVYVVPNADASGNATTVSGVLLATGAKLWTKATPIVATVPLAIAGPVDIARGSAADGYPTTAISPLTGRVVWQMHGGNDCGASAGIFVMENADNTQQTIVTAATGKTSRSTANCQFVVPGAILDSPAHQTGSFTVIPEPAASVG
jgi:hypothetical protein